MFDLSMKHVGRMIHFLQSRSRHIHELTVKAPSIGFWGLQTNFSKQASLQIENLQMIRIGCIYFLRDHLYTLVFIFMHLGFIVC